MIYKCVDCGHIFEEGEQAVWYEDRGEFWGVPCSERMTGCPICNGDYEETTGIMDYMKQTKDRRKTK
jgi:hypothetical protein